MSIGAVAADVRLSWQVNLLLASSARGSTANEGRPANRDEEGEPAQEGEALRLSSSSGSSGLSRNASMGANFVSPTVQRTETVHRNR